MSEGYRTISVKTELANFVESFIAANPEYGYRSIAQFVEDASRKRLEELKALGMPPRFDHFNLDPNMGIRISDKKRRMIADIYVKPTGLFCDLDKSDDCEHIAFALTVPAFQDIIRDKRRKEGWKLPDV
jgi:hypothetical protein